MPDRIAAGRDAEHAPNLKTTFNLGRAGELDLSKLGDRLGANVQAQLLRRGSEEYAALFASYLMGDQRDFEALGLMVGE